MSDEPDDQERPCLHCMVVDLIDDFYDEYPAAIGEPVTIDPSEVVTAIAKTVAELTCGQDARGRGDRLQTSGDDVLIRRNPRVKWTEFSEATRPLRCPSPDRVCWSIFSS
jgi:hypothetical protein